MGEVSNFQEYGSVNQNVLPDTLEGEGQFSKVQMVIEIRSEFDNHSDRL